MLLVVYFSSLFVFSFVVLLLVCYVRCGVFVVLFVWCVLLVVVCGFGVVCLSLFVVCCLWWWFVWFGVVGCLFIVARCGLLIVACDLVYVVCS